MISSNYFFSIFIITIILTRLIVYFYPTPSPTIIKFRIHHYMYGVVGVILALIINSITLYAIGLGLFIDELTYILIGGKTHKDNYSMKSLIGTLVFIIVVFLLKYYLTLTFIS
jgi:hypothetical protein